MSPPVAVALVVLALLGLLAAVERAAELWTTRRALTHTQRRLARTQRTLDATRAGIRASDHARDVALVERDAARRSASEARTLLGACSDELNRLRCRLTEQRAPAPSPQTPAPPCSERDGRMVIARELLLRGAALRVQVPLGPVPTWRVRHLPFETLWGAA